MFVVTEFVVLLSMSPCPGVRKGGNGRKGRTGLTDVFANDAEICYKIWEELAALENQNSFNGNEESMTFLFSPVSRVRC